MQQCHGRGFTEGRGAAGCGFWGCGCGFWGCGCGSGGTDRLCTVPAASRHRRRGRRHVRLRLGGGAAAAQARGQDEEGQRDAPAALRQHRQLRQRAPAGRRLRVPPRYLEPRAQHRQSPALLRCAALRLLQRPRRPMRLALPAASKRALAPPMPPTPTPPTPTPTPKPASERGGATRG